MSERRVLTIAAAMVFTGIAAAFLLVRPLTERDDLPHDLPALAARLAKHPTDWRTASAISELSLDSRLAQRQELRRAAYQLALLLAPARGEPRTAFARSGFFHWTELSESDRRQVLEAFAPQLESGAFFRMAQPIFSLTGDLTILRKHHPDTDEALGWIERMAATNGLFADYRAVRDQLTERQIADFGRRVESMSSADIIAALPPPPYHADIQPMLAAALRELAAKPISEDPGRPAVTEALADYALRHDMKPLDGLEALTRFPAAASQPTRERLARKLGFEQRAAAIELSGFRAPPPPASGWNGECDAGACMHAWRDVDVAKPPLVVVVSTAESDEVPPYVEFYLDDVRVAEDAVRGAATFTIAATPGTHRVEVMVANPGTRNQGRRRVRVSVLPAR